MLSTILVLSAAAVLLQISTVNSIVTENSLKFEDEYTNTKVRMEFLSPAEMHEYIKQFPNAQEMKVTFSVPSKESRLVVLYSLGVRINGDTIAGSEQGAASWPTPRSSVLEIVYPRTGVIPKVVTYVTIGVNRSNALGRAYITSGGIGQSNITFAVEAINTLWLNYSLDIYGL